MKSIDNILDLASEGVLSLVGGGGKTSLMFHLAQLLTKKGKRVLTTTTTKIFVPSSSQSETLLIDEDPRAILRQVGSLTEGGGHVTAAALHMEGTDKLKGFAPEAIGVFEKSGLFDWIIVEADGSARRPLKAPAEHEPVVPGNTTHLVAVVGLDVLGCCLTEDVVFRVELASERMGLKIGEVITDDALARILDHPLGSFKGAPLNARRYIFLNQADDSERCEAAKRIAALLRQSPSPVATSLIVGQALESIQIHACHPLRK